MFIKARVGSHILGIMTLVVLITKGQGDKAAEVKAQHEKELRFFICGGA